jgi:hypothetical protein
LLVLKAKDAARIVEVEQLAPTKDEFVFDKLAMSFEGTPLQFALRDRGITTLAIFAISCWPKTNSGLENWEGLRQVRPPRTTVSTAAPCKRDLHLATISRAYRS